MCLKLSCAKSTFRRGLNCTWDVLIVHNILHDDVINKNRQDYVYINGDYQSYICTNIIKDNKKDCSPLWKKHQTSQEKLVAKPETPLYDIPVDNLNMT